MTKYLCHSGCMVCLSFFSKVIESIKLLMLSYLQSIEANDLMCHCKITVSLWSCREIS